MSVPTHNLYDFVYQLVKNKLFVRAFYPWGNKDISNCILVHPDIHTNEIKKLHKDNKYFSNNYPDNYFLYVPFLICHDQEPLFFDLYSDQNIQDFKIKLKQNDNYSYVDLDNLNLRILCPYDYHRYCILLHSELNSKELEKYKDTNNFMPAYWWSHAVISRDWYRYAEYDKSLSPELDITKDFLVYCRDTSGHRHYRQKFKNEIKKEKIDHHCQFSSFNQSDNITSDLSATYCSNDFNKTLISIVLETVFDERIHLTEKTLRPIACGHPFIIANGPGALDYIRSYGFKSFSPYIDESYNEELNNDKRIMLIIKEMKRISNLSPNDKNELRKKCLEIAEFNKNLFFSRDFFDNILAELEENINKAYRLTAYNFCYKKIWKLYNDRKKAIPDFYVLRPARRKSLLALIWHLKKGGTLENYVPPDLD